MTKVKKGIICGSFDLLHAGYIRMFKDAKENACDHLIVALQTDPTIDRPEKNKCVQPYNQREEILRSISYVDEVLMYSTEKSLEELLSCTEYDVRILGTDYRGKKYTGQEIDREVYYHKRNHDISTSKLKRKIHETFHKKSQASKIISLAQLDVMDRLGVR